MDLQPPCRFPQWWRVGTLHPHCLKGDGHPFERTGPQRRRAVNSGPLTKVSDYPHDLDALVPNHLLLLRSGPTLPPVFSGRKTFTPDGGGAKYNTCQTCFGTGGLKNTFKKDTRKTQVAKSDGQISSWRRHSRLWMRILHEIPGR